jgi:hypothetical protein
MQPRSRSSALKTISRRQLLATAGLSACAYPFVPLLRASAQPLYPKRLLLFYTPHGTIYDNWKPSGTTTDFTLGPILAPLERHKASIAVLDGLRIEHSRVPAPPHTEGMSLCWTGSHLGAGNTFMVQEFPIDWVEGPSVDQVIAQRIGGATAFRSLELGIRPGGSSPTSRMIYAGARQPVQPESDPARAFDRLFGGGAPGAEPDPAVVARLARRRSVLDVVAGQLTGLQSKVGREDRMKIDAHLAAVRDLEQRSMYQPATCQLPPRESADDIPGLFDLELELISAAFACDRTRVASIQLKFGDNDNESYTWLGIDRGHHDTSHDGDGNAQSRADLTTIYTWYADRFAHLLDTLDAVPEGDGTLLDNTLVVWGTEIGKGNTHAFERVPFVLAGGAGGSIAMGRYLQFADVPHNRLLVSICHAMGVSDVDQFGTTDTGSGGLAGL